MTLYRERLWPSPWVWVLGFGVVLMLAWALGFALGPLWGLAVLGGGALVVLAAFALTVPVIRVSDTVVRVGRAVIPLAAVARVTVIDAAAMRAALRDPPGIPYLATRPWAARTGLVLELNDPGDPHTHWLVTSRRAEELRSVILTATASGDRGTLRP